MALDGGPDGDGGGGGAGVEDDGVEDEDGGGGGGGGVALVVGRFVVADPPQPANSRMQEIQMRQDRQSKDLKICTTNNSRVIW